LVVAFSPNSPLPTGANVIGAVTQSAGPWTENLTQVASNAVATAATGVQKVGIVGGAGTSLETTAGVIDHNLKNVGNSAVTTLAAGEQKVAVEGLAASGAVLSGNPVLTGGSDATDIRTFMTDTLGIGIGGDFTYAAAIARIPGALADHRFGFSSGGGTPQHLDATTYTEQASAAIRSLSSSSGSDTAAGIGARQVTITGFDASMNALSEVVTLNGTTAVATTNSYRFIERLQVTSVGTGSFNVGTITLYVNNAGGGGTIGTIGVGNRASSNGDNETYWAHHYVRAGKTMFLLGMSAAMTGVTSGVTYGTSINPTVATSAELIRTPMLGTRQAMVTYAFRVPITIVGPARFTMYNSSTGGNECDGSFEYVEF
jgi:hypothetical protein